LRLAGNSSSLATFLLRYWCDKRNLHRLFCAKIKVG
jgi:hypothetical protein